MAGWGVESAAGWSERVRPDGGADIFRGHGGEGPFWVSNDLHVSAGGSPYGRVGGAKNDGRRNATGGGEVGRAGVMAEKEPAEGQLIGEFRQWQAVGHGVGDAGGVEHAAEIIEYWRFGLACDDEEVGAGVCLQICGQTGPIVETPIFTRATAAGVEGNEILNLIWAVFEEDRGFGWVEKEGQFSEWGGQLGRRVRPVIDGPMPSAQQGGDTGPAEVGVKEVVGVVQMTDDHAKRGEVLTPGWIQGGVGYEKAGEGGVLEAAHAIGQAEIAGEVDDAGGAEDFHVLTGKRVSEQPQGWQVKHEVTEGAAADDEQAAACPGLRGWEIHCGGLAARGGGLANGGP